MEDLTSRGPAEDAEVEGESYHINAVGQRVNPPGTKAQKRLEAQQREAERRKKYELHPVPGERVVHKHYIVEPGYGGDRSTAKFILCKQYYDCLYGATKSIPREYRIGVHAAQRAKKAYEKIYTLVAWDPDTNEAHEPCDVKMEEDDDEFYGPDTSTGAAGDQTDTKGASNGNAAEKDEMDAELESGEEEEEEEESDSDIEIITDRPQAPIKPITQPAVDSIKEASRAPAEPSPARTSQQQGSAAKTPLAPPTAASAPQQLGTSFPRVDTSTIKIDADPVYPPVGKPVTQIDIDADLAESTKPWRLPGADQSDYFNYGFDEFSWEMYRQKQVAMASTLSSQKAEMQQFQQMFGGGSMPMPGGGAAPSAAPPVPNAPTGPAAQQNNQMAAMGPMAQMMGMNEEQMMQAMQSFMMSNGISDPSQMDFGSFMASMGQAMPGQPQPQQQQQQQAGYGQPNQGGYGGGGYGGGAQGGGGNYGGGRGGGGRRGGRW